MNKLPSTVPEIEESVSYGFTTVAMTPEQERKWTDTMSMLTWVAPGFLHLFYKLLNAQNNTAGNYVAIVSRDVPAAATDGLNIIVNPDVFFAWSLPRRVYVIVHEIIHNMYDDVALLHSCRDSGFVLLPDGSKLPFIADIMQVSMDARINALIDESQIGVRPEEGIFDKTVKGSASVFDVYKKYYDKAQSQPPPPQGQPGGPGQSQPQPGKGQPQKNPPKAFDQLLKPGQATGKDPHQAKQVRSPEQWAVAIAEAKHLEERSRGDLPMGMEILFRELLEPEVSWLDQVDTLVNRLVGDDGVNWAEPHPWFGSTDSGDDYFVPSNTGLGAGWIVLWGDTSQSVNDAHVQARNISEMAGLMEQVRPARLTLLWCDCKLHDGSVVEITDAAELREVKPVGGGGTSYAPVLDWIAKNNRGEVPDLMIGFTDGEVNHPKRAPEFPIIWACNTGNNFPFGKVVRINNLARKGS